MFCDVIKRDSVSLVRFPFLNHVYVCLWEIPPVCCLKYPYSCFSSHFCFLVFLNWFLSVIMLPVLLQASVLVYYHFRLIGQVGRLFANGPGDPGSIQGRVIPKTFKMVLDTSLLNTQQCKVRMKGKVEQTRERSSAHPYTSVLYLLKREPSGRPRLKGDNFTYYLLVNSYWCIASPFILFLDTSNLSMSSPRCKVLCKLIKVPVV